MLNRRSFLTLIAATAAAGTAPLLQAADDKQLKVGEWEKLGTKEAGRKEERDVFEVAAGHRYTAISFRVDKGDLSIEDVKVTFDDDTTFSPDTKLVFKEGDRSGKIDLPGKSRAIKRVRFLYRSLGREAAVLHLYGKLGEAEKK